MKKLSLNLEMLTVQSFMTQAAPGSPGTVLGHSGASCNTYDQATCANYWLRTCGGYESCNDRCTGQEECLPLREGVDWVNNGIEEESDPNCCTVGCP